MKWLVFGSLSVCLLAQTDTQSTGQFEGHGDIGTVLHPGSVAFDPAAQRYTVTASGQNIWGTADAFQFAWKKMSGDVALTADISFPETGGGPHKKAVIMVRQSLDADSAYADVAIHGNGLTSLQARETKGAATHEIQSNLSAPQRLRILKRGSYFYMRLGTSNEAPAVVGGAMQIPMEGSFYVGLGVSAHNKDAVEKAVFSNVTMEQLPATTGKPKLYSTLETVTVSSTDRRVAYVVPQVLQSPRWSTDGLSLTFDNKGKQERIALGNGVTMPVEQGKARTNDTYQVSPDGKTRVFAMKHRGSVAVYTVPVSGGKTSRLTEGEGANEGPEYSPDGKYIYFYSNRTGNMQIWRMLANGTGEEQITSDEMNNCLPHISPNGQQLVFLSFPKENKKIPENQEVSLRMMTLETKRVKVLAKLLGGKGTIDAPSWSPDSKRLAFVSYQLIP